MARPPVPQARTLTSRRDAQTSLDALKRRLIAAAKAYLALQAASTGTCTRENRAWQAVDSVRVVRGDDCVSRGREFETWRWQKGKKGVTGVRENVFRQQSQWQAWGLIWARENDMEFPGSLYGKYRKMIYGPNKLIYNLEKFICIL